MDETGLIECIDEHYMVLLQIYSEIIFYEWLSENSVCKG